MPWSSPPPTLPLLSNLADYLTWVATLNDTQLHDLQVAVNVFMAKELATDMPSYGTFNWSINKTAFAIKLEADQAALYYTDPELLAARALGWFAGYARYMKRANQINLAFSAARLMHTNYTWQSDPGDWNPDPSKG